MTNKKLDLQNLSVEGENPSTQENVKLDNATNNTAIDAKVPVSNFESLSDVPISVSVVLGSAKMTLGNVLKFHKGAVIELDKQIGELVEIFVNEKLIAKGEVVLVEDKIAVSIVELAD